jgi:predicted outer membrane protein
MITEHEKLIERLRAAGSALRVDMPYTAGLASEAADALAALKHQGAET